MSSNATLGRAGWPAGYGLHRLAQVDSTNAEAARLAASASGPLWITAERQTAGRGRRGRPWVSPEGALVATLLLFPDDPPATAALRSFVAALALNDALQSQGVPPGAIGLKWPNDVLVHDCKIAGILLECAGQGDRLGYLAVGIGINLNAAPTGCAIEPGATSPIALAEVIGRPVARDEMLSSLAVAYAKREAQFAKHGFRLIRDDWLSRATRLGGAITARTLRDQRTGTFETVDDAGNLILRDGTGSHAIPAADVFF